MWSYNQKYRENMISPKKNKLLILTLSCLPAYSQALSTDREQPVYVEAEEVEIDNHKGISRYHGNVRFKQGSLIIRGTTVLLYHKQGQLDKVIISGKPASFQQMPDKGGISIVSRAERMEYIARQSRLLLFQNARVSQGKNVFSGEKIEYDMVQGTVVANRGKTGSKRINAILDENKPDSGVK